MKKTRSSCKSDFRNKLQLMSPLKPTSIPPADIKVCVVYAMRVLEIDSNSSYTATNFYEMGRGSKNIVRKSTRKHTTCCT